MFSPKSEPFSWFKVRFNAKMSRKFNFCRHDFKTVKHNSLKGMGMDIHCECKGIKKAVLTQLM